MKQTAKKNAKNNTAGTPQDRVSHTHTHNKNNLSQHQCNSEIHAMGIPRSNAKTTPGTYHRNQAPPDSRPARVSRDIIPPLALHLVRPYHRLPRRLVRPRGNVLRADVRCPLDRGYGPNGGEIGRAVGEGGEAEEEVGRTASGSGSGYSGLGRMEPRTGIRKRYRPCRFSDHIVPGREGDVRGGDGVRRRGRGGGRRGGRRSGRSG